LDRVVPQAQGLLEALLNLLEATGLQTLEVLEVFLNVTNSHLKEIIPNLGLIKIPLHQHPHRVGGLTLRVPVDLWLLALFQVRRYLYMPFALSKKFWFIENYF
jgi:hypothetical protein